MAQEGVLAAIPHVPYNIYMGSHGAPHSSHNYLRWRPASALSPFDTGVFAR